MGIIYTVQKSGSEIQMYVWSDSDWVADTDIRRSIIIFCISIVGSVFIWVLKK